MPGPQDVFLFTDSGGYGGAEQSMLTLIDGLDRERWRPTLLHHHDHDAGRLRAAAAGLDVQLMAVPRMDEGLAGAVRVPSLAALLRRRRPAVFHAHLTWPISCKYGLAAAILARVPAIVATEHAFLEIPVGRSRYRQQQVLARGVDRYIAVSHYVRQRLLETFHWPESKVVVIPNGVDVVAYRALPDPGLRARLSRDETRKVLLALARLDPWRGLRYLLAAAARIPGTQVVLAGEGDERSELERLGRELDIEDRVDFLGHRDDVEQLLACADVVVQPSLVEAFGLAALQAMCAGKPIVATAVGGTPELLSDGETALLVPPADVEALELAICRMLDDPAAAAVMGGTARRRAQRFSRQRMVQAVAQVYADLLARGANKPAGGLEPPTA